MISMLWLWVYLCGALVSAAGASVAADLFSEPDVPGASRTKVIVFAGVAWPVLLVGLFELTFIGVATAVSTASAAQHVSRPAMRYGRLERVDCVEDC
jgi:hypothetical protein